VKLPAVAPPVGEAFWTVRAVLASDSPWADAGHEIAWGQWQVAPWVPMKVAPAAPAAKDRVGPGAFEGGRLVRLNSLPLVPPRLDVWRAPTDNDIMGPRLADKWRWHGLHRMHERIVSVAVVGDALVVAARVAPAAADFGLAVEYRWSGSGTQLRLDLSVDPVGEWPVVLPRLGLRFGLPSSIARVKWYGGGPGEAYADTRQALRVGRYEASVDEMQFPYVMPQENGARMDVRWASLIDPAGPGLRIEGEPGFILTVRRWTSEQLDAARHTDELVPGDHVWVNADLALHGIGTASCGPGVLPQYELHAAAARYSLVFSTLH
jgi:beta-galactosidase